MRPALVEVSTGVTVRVVVVTFEVSVASEADYE